MNPSKSSNLCWQGPAIALVDLDAFFASVEQLDHPEWKNKPVLVGGDAKRRGVISCASYEARAYGAHAAMPTQQALSLCPQAILTPGRYERYQEVSTCVMQIIQRETPYVEQVSIDEAFFDISPGRFSKESPLDICKRIQKNINNLGITCSIGLGINKTIAKIASEKEKPHGFCAVFPGTEKEFLSPLSIDTMSGIGKQTAKKLKAMHIQTLGQLAHMDTNLASRLFGIQGEKMIMRAKGEEISEVKEAAKEELPQSISNERTFAQDLTDKEEIIAAINFISGMVARRLRKNNLVCAEVSLHLKFSYTSSKTIQVHLDEYTDNEKTIANYATELLKKIWHQNMPVRLIGVGCSKLIYANNESEHSCKQMSLFDNQDTSALNKDRSLSSATDAIKDKFGDSAVVYGHDLRFVDRLTKTPSTRNEH